MHEKAQIDVQGRLRIREDARIPQGRKDGKCIRAVSEGRGFRIALLKLLRKIKGKKKEPRRAATHLDRIGLKRTGS